MRPVIAIVLISALLTLAGTWMLLSVGSPHEATGALLTMAVLAGLATIDWLITRELGILSPVRVYLVLALAAVGFGWAIYFFSYLGPVRALLLAVGLGGVVLILTAIRRPNTRPAREAAGLCTECGYDLRASEERCPECNAPLPESLTRRRRIAQQIRAARHPGPDELPPGPPALGPGGHDDPPSGLDP